MLSAMGMCCCGPSPTCSVTVHVNGCSGDVQGATVNIWTDSSKASLVVTGTTDSSGNASLDVGTAATYYREIVATGFVTNTASVAFACGSTYSTTLTRIAGFECDPCCLGAAIPDTIYVTDSVGTTALAADGGANPGGVAGWSGTTTFSSSSAVRYIFNGVGNACTVGTYDCFINYSVWCDGTNWYCWRNWGEAHSDASATIWYYDGHTSNIFPTPCGTGATFGAGSPESHGSVPKASVTCKPFSFSGTMTPQDNNLADPGGGSFAVSA